jgi:SAM-dependent methyltransferase
VLDVGTGTGFIAAGLASRAARVVAIDNSPAMLDVARDNLAQLRIDNIELRESDHTELPLDDDSVDAAVANMVVHHAEDPARILAEMTRVVRPGGWAAITEVDGLDQRAAAQFRISRTDLHLIDRLRSEGPQTPSQLARSVGLTSGGLSIALERLERLGYIRRSLHPHDRRSILVEPTEAIVPLETEVFGLLIQRINALLESYNDKQLASIRDFLDQAGTAISQSVPGTPPPTGRATPLIPPAAIRHPLTGAARHRRRRVEDARVSYVRVGHGARPRRPRPRYPKSW